MRAAYSPYGNNGDAGPFKNIFDVFYNPLVDNNLQEADALILWGGTDIHPKFYKEKAHPKNQSPGFVSARDEIEWHLMREAYRMNIPIIGVCRGAQFLCAFAGGSLIQDVTNHYVGHEVQTYDGHVFYAPGDHHQMMNPDGTEYELLAWSKEKKSVWYQNGEGKEASRLLEEEPEVIWFPEVKGFAIQPHPEWGPMGTEFNNWLVNEISTRIFAKD